MVYADGIPRLSTTMTVLNWSANLKLGVAQPAASQFLNGQVDEAAFYNRALTDSEITAHYNAR